MENLLEKIVWDGFGFPVVINGVGWKINSSGYKVLDIDIQTLSDLLCEALLLKKTPLTGLHVKYLRKILKYSQEDFGLMVGKTTASVADLEEKKDSPTGMDLNTELVLRLRIAHKFNIELITKVLIYIVLESKINIGTEDLPVEIFVSNEADIELTEPENIILSDLDRDLFSEIISNKAEPNAAMKKAMNNYKRMVISPQNIIDKIEEIAMCGEDVSEHFGEPSVVEGIKICRKKNPNT